MTVTALDIITSALQKVGVYAPGEPLSDADAERGLVVLNDMLDEWAALYTYVWQVTTLTIPLTANQSAYSITHIPKIVYGPGQGSVTTIAGTSAVDVISALEWYQIYGVSPGTGQPSKAFYDPSWPNGTINVAPTPAAAGELTLSQYVILQAFANLSTAYALATGSYEALRSNLCIAAKAYWTQANIDPTIVGTAAQARKALALQTLNSRAVPGRLRSADKPPAQGRPQ